MFQQVRRIVLAVGLVAVSASLVVACGGSGSSDNAASSTTAERSITTGSSGGSSGGSTSSKNASKIQFINVWGGDPAGRPIDIYQATGVDSYKKVVSGLKLGQSTGWLGLEVSGYGIGFQVTKPGGTPKRDDYANNVQINNVAKGEYGVLVIGWDPKAGPTQTGGTLFRSLNLKTDDSVKPVAGKVKVKVSLSGAMGFDSAMLGVVGKGCLGDDGLNEPSVVFAPGPLKIQGIRSATSTANCTGEVQAAPVSIDGTAGSSWIVAVYGTEKAQKLTAVDVTPG